MVLLAALALVPNPAPRSPARAEANTVRVTEAAYEWRGGKRVKGYRTPTYTLAVGDTIAFAYRDNSSTGIVWGEAKIRPKGILGGTTMTVVAPPVTVPPTVVAPTALTMSLKALKPGRAAFEMSSVGPGRRAPLVDRVRFNVVVRPGTR